MLYAIIGVPLGRVADLWSRKRLLAGGMAIGAKPGDVLRMVLGQGLVFTAIGVGAGLVMAFFASKVVSGFVIGVSPRDPAIFLSIPFILAAVMVAACWVPARRAARIDPTIALRQE